MKTVAAVIMSLAAVATVSSQSPAGSVAQGSPGKAVNASPQAYRTTGARIGLGKSIHIPVDEEVAEAVVVVGGSARIDGRVRDGVVVVGGNLTFGPRSDVRGEVVVVGGRVHRETGAQVRARVSEITFGEWSSWTVGGISMPVVEFGNFGRWVTLVGTVFRIAFLALAMALFVLVARRPVARIGRSAAAEPGRAFALGLVAEILFLPVLIIVTVSLVITIIGIPLAVILLPAAIIAGFIAFLLGFTALTCRFGEWIEDRMGWRTDSAILAMSIGLVLIVTPTIVARLIGVAPEPMRWAAFGMLAFGLVLEFIVWTIGLGATLMTGFGRWTTAPPPIPPSVQATVLPATN